MIDFLKHWDDAKAAYLEEPLRLVSANTRVDYTVAVTGQLV